MQEELEKAYQEVWGCLETGEWFNATIAASHLVGLDPANKESQALARYVRKIAEVADKVKNSPKRGAAARLEEIARILPKLNELTSFRSLIESARYTSGKKGIVISIIVAIVFILACNLAGYQYIQAQPPHVDSQNDITRAWLGIQKLGKPVDVLLLGDSACVNNLAPGAVADRLGGRVINLGNNAGSSLLMDAWMLSDYISKCGAPRAVVITRTSLGYSIKHSVEFMANPLLPWDYWDEYGVAPDWQDGEERELFIAKYGVLYSDADVLRERLLKMWDLFDYSLAPRSPSHNYSAGINLPKQDMDINMRTPVFYFNKFYYSADATNAIKCMVSLARKYHFQLYFALQPEWDEAVKSGLRSEHLATQNKYLSQFTDETYVHVVDQMPKTLFTNKQMQSPNHLWHGSEKIYTEEIVNGITAIQNNLTAGQARNMELTSVSLDKDSYQPGDQPTITLNVTDPPGDVAATILKGSVSCLVKPSGDIDANWVARAPATTITLNGDEIKEISLQLTAGTIPAGTYDLVVFLRQDVGSLSHETRIEIPNKLILK